METKAHYLIRAKTDKKICFENGKRSKQKIKATLKSEKPLGQIAIHISKTKKRKAREVHMLVYSKKIHIALPDKQKKAKDYKPVEITAVLCVENNPPAGAETIE